MALGADHLALGGRRALTGGGRFVSPLFFDNSEKKEPDLAKKEIDLPRCGTADVPSRGIYPIVDRRTQE